MRQIAPQMAAQPGNADGLPLAGDTDQGADDQQAKNTTVQHDLEGINLAAQFAPRHRHRRKRQNRPDHPERRTGYVAFARHGGPFVASRGRDLTGVVKQIGGTNVYQSPQWHPAPLQNRRDPDRTPRL